MIIYLLISTLSFFIFYLTGCIINNYFKYKIHWTDEFFLGVIVYTTFISLVHFFIPVNIFIPLILTVIFIFLLCINKFLNLKLIVRFPFNRLFLLLLLTIIMYPFIVFGSITYDHYLYHDQVVSWFNSYKLCFGLGNLHGRFAFNNALFPTVSSFQFDFKSNWYFLNSQLFLIFVFKIINFIRINNSLVKRLSSIIFVSILFINGLKYFNSTSPDFQINIFISLIIFNLISGINHVKSKPYVILLCIFSVAIKLNFIPFLFIILTVILYKDVRELKKINFKSYLIAIFFFIVWIVRSLCISGQFIYPFPLIHNDFFKHTVSKVEVENEAIAVTGWAQNPGENYRVNYFKNRGTLNWVPLWFKTRMNQTYSRIPYLGKISYRIFVLLSLFVGIFYFLCSFLEGNKDKYVIVSATLFNTLFWFLKGPDIRFGFMNFLILLFLPVLISNKIKLLDRFVFCFILMCWLYQLKLIYRTTFSNYFQYYKVFVLESRHLKYKSVIKNRMDYNKYFIYTEDKKDSFVYFHPVKGDQSCDTLFPGLPYKLKNIVFSKNSNRLTFYKNIK